MDFTGKVFIVTGASSGIGLSTAKQILEFGGNVVGIDRNESALDDESYEHYKINVTDEQLVENMIKSRMIIVLSLNPQQTCRNIYN